MKYDCEIDMTTDNSFSLILQRIKPGSRILEFGPATGYMTKYMKEKLGCKIYCIEIDTEAAEIANKYCEKMIVTDIDCLQWTEELPENYFDYVIFADVLEHLKNPWKALKRAADFLKKGGTVITSIPNIGHSAIIMELLQGRFDYQRSGLLDDTHIRFFTRKSILNLLARAELCPVKWLAVINRPEDTEFKQKYSNFPETVQDFLKNVEDNHVYQYITVSKRLTDVNEKNCCIDLSTRNNGGSYLQVFWSTKASDFLEADSAKVPLQYDGGMVTYEVPLPSKVKGYLRIDPGNVNAYGEIKNISIKAINSDAAGVKGVIAYSNYENNFIGLSPGAGLLFLHSGKYKRYICIGNDPQMIFSLPEVDYGQPLILEVTMRNTENMPVNALLEVSCMQKELFNKTRQLEKQTNELDKATQQLEQLLHELDETKHELDETNLELHETTFKWSETTTSLKERELQVVDQQQRLQSLNDEFLSVTVSLQESHAQLSSVLHSHSWRVTAPVRWVADNLKLLISKVVSEKFNYNFRLIKTKLKYINEVSTIPVSNGRVKKWQLKISKTKWLHQVFWWLRAKTMTANPVLYDVRVKKPINVTRPKIIHAIPNTFVGGSTQLIIDLIEYLGHKYDMEIITYALPPIGKHKGLVIHDLSGIQSGEEAAEFLKSKKADLVHIHYWGEGDTPWYQKIFEATETYSCKLVENINTPIEAYINPRVNHYVYVSEYAQRMFGKWPENSSVIYPGIDFTHFTPSNSENRPDAVGMVYRLEGDKLREDAIQVFIELAKRRPQTLIYIVGSGTFFNKYLEQVYQANVRNNFVFTGYVPYAQLPQIYDKFSVFVAPVWKESFGQVSPFAMNKEIVVAGYDIGALSEILNGTDTLASNIDELVDIIINLLDNPEILERKGKEMRQRAQENFCVKVMVSKYEEIYETLLSQ